MLASFLPSFLPHPAALFAAFDWRSLLLPLLWFSVILLTLVIESQTADLVSIWFAPGAFIAMILAFCDVHITVQLAVFVVITVVGLILTFTVIRPRLKASRRNEKTNAEALAGRTVLVEEDIDNRIPTGVVKINGQLWTARMEEPTDRAAKGDWVEIVRVEGAKLICKRKS
jgi:membrane protein implicated in regulation of membrane protease activity